MKIDVKLEADIKEYCKLNGIKATEFVNNILKKGLMTEKYGNKPLFGSQTGKDKVKKAIYYSFSLPIVENVAENDEQLTDGYKKVRKTRKLT
jgi:hypothetical protein